MKYDWNECTEMNFSLYRTVVLSIAICLSTTGRVSITLQANYLYWLLRVFGQSAIY